MWPSPRIAIIRFIPEPAVAPKAGMGSALAATGRDLGGIELDFKRDTRPI
jgi:hypothetical protein